MSEVIAITNQKGGVGKTMTTVQLGVGLVEARKKVLLIDADPQGTLTNNLGFRPVEQLPATLATLIAETAEEPDVINQCILHQPEGVDVIPANNELAGTERDLVNSNDRTVLKRIIDPLRSQYDYILIDCMPSLGALTLNALTAADSVIIPVIPSYEAAQGLQQLLNTIANTQQNLNANLRICGVLLTNAEEQTILARTVSQLIQETYGNNIRIFTEKIPHTVRLAETGTHAQSIFAYARDTKDRYSEKAANAYMSLAKEVMVHA